MSISCYIPVADLFDKISILRIKMEKIDDVSKKRNILEELTILERKLSEFNRSRLLLEHNIYLLGKVNRLIWDLEEWIRDITDPYDPNDVAKAAIEIAKLNDVRYSIKKEINEEFDSDLMEEKSHG